MNKSEAHNPAPRTLEQVKACLAKCAKNGSDQRMASMMLRHGNLTDEAFAYVENYPAKA